MSFEHQEFVIDPTDIDIPVVPYFFEENREMISGCAQSFEHDESMQNVPLVKMMLDSSLEVLNIQKYSGKISPSVNHRLSTALAAVNSVIDKAVAEGIFADYTDSFSEALSEEGISYTAQDVEPEDIARLSSAPFQDVSWVGRGALKLLRDSNVEADYADVIAGSNSLKRIASIAFIRMDDAREALGLPGISTDYLQIGRGAKVEFNEAGLKIIRNFIGTGCPARKIASDEYSVNIFDESWHGLVSYCLPPNVSLSDLD